MPWGQRTARKQGHPIRSKLDAHNAYLLGLIEQTVDITLDEMRHRLAEERGVRAGYGTTWRFALSQANMWSRGLHLHADSQLHGRTRDKVSLNRPISLRKTDQFCAGIDTPPFFDELHA